MFSITAASSMQAVIRIASTQADRRCSVNTLRPARGPGAMREVIECASEPLHQLLVVVWPERAGH
jgi:hypothetical protein